MVANVFVVFRGPKKETLGEYRLKVEFLRKVVTTLEDEKLEVEAKYLMNAANLNDEDGTKFPRRKTSLPSHRGSPSGRFINQPPPFIFVILIYHI